MLWTGPFCTIQAVERGERAGLPKQTPPASVRGTHVSQYVYIYCRMIRVQCSVAIAFRVCRCACCALNVEVARNGQRFFGGGGNASDLFCVYNS